MEHNEIISDMKQQPIEPSYDAAIPLLHPTAYIWRNPDFTFADNMAQNLKKLQLAWNAAKEAINSPRAKARSTEHERSVELHITMLGLIHRLIWECRDDQLSEQMFNIKICDRTLLVKLGHVHEAILKVASRCGTRQKFNRTMEKIEARFSNRFKDAFALHDRRRLIDEDFPSAVFYRMYYRVMIGKPNEAIGRALDTWSGFTMTNRGEEFFITQRYGLIIIHFVETFFNCLSELI